MIVYCRQHATSIGVVILSPGGVPQFKTRGPRWRDRLAAEAEMGHDNELTNFNVPLPSDVRAWCRKEDEPRSIKVAVLLEAFEGGRSKTSNVLRLLPAEC